MPTRALRPFIAAAAGNRSLAARHNRLRQTAPQGREGRGRLFLSLADGTRGPLILSFPVRGAGWGRAITNVGTEPLTVSRVAVRGDEDDVRSPAHVSVRFVDGAKTSATLAPGTARELFVSWMPDRDPRVRQAFGHVLVTSSDEGAGEVAMGFRAQLPTGLGWVGEHVLTAILVLWPLVLLPFAGTAYLAGRRDDPLVGQASAQSGGLRVAARPLGLPSRCAGVGRADGNDGFQLVEHNVWVRSVGVEGTWGWTGQAIPLVVPAALLGTIAAVFATADRRDAAHHAALRLLTSTVVGTLVALDLGSSSSPGSSSSCAVVILVGGMGRVAWPARRSQARDLRSHRVHGHVAAFVALSRAIRPHLPRGRIALDTISADPRACPPRRWPLRRRFWLAHVEMGGRSSLVAAAAASFIVPMHGCASGRASGGSFQGDHRHRWGRRALGLCCG